VSTGAGLLRPSGLAVRSSRVRYVGFVTGEPQSPVLAGSRTRSPHEFVTGLLLPWSASEADRHGQ